MITFGHNPKVEIDCEPGIYMFIEYSAIGKTYLCKLISRASEGNLPYVAYTYTDYIHELDLAKVCKKCEAQLVFIDRYDMYCDDTALQNQILDISQNAVVLIDLKTGNLPIKPNGFVVINRTPDLLEVS